MARSDPLRVARAALVGAERLLADVESGLFDRDLEDCRRHVVELQGDVERLSAKRLPLS